MAVKQPARLDAPRHDVQPPTARAAATELGIDRIFAGVRPEDKAVIEGVQRGMRSGGFTAGQLANGSDEDGRWTEHAVAHFQSLVRDALQVDKGKVE